MGGGGQNSLVHNDQFDNFYAIGIAVQPTHEPVHGPHFTLTRGSRGKQKGRADGSYAEPLPV